MWRSLTDSRNLLAVTPKIIHPRLSQLHNVPILCDIVTLFCLTQVDSFLVCSLHDLLVLAARFKHTHSVPLAYPAGSQHLNQHLAIIWVSAGADSVTAVYLMSRAAH